MENEWITPQEPNELKPAIDTLLKDLQEYVDQASPEEKEKLKGYGVLPQHSNNLKNQNTMDNNIDNLLSVQRISLVCFTIKEFFLNKKKIVTLKKLKKQ